MKKVANITLHAINNYGSVFQALATEHLINSLGYQCETIDFTRETAFHLSVGQIIVSSKIPFVMKMKMILLKTSEKKFGRVFDEFRNKYLSLSKTKYLGDNSIRSNPPEADIYCTGSDQVWNPTWQEGVPGPFLLDFAPDDKKKIAFSASIGIEEMPDQYVKDYKRLLSRYSAISVRESSAVDLLKKMDIDSTLVLDPTLVAGAGFWNKIASPRIIKEDYIFIYQLGHESYLSKYAIKFAQAHNLKIYRLCGDYFNALQGGIPVLFPTPEEILSYIKYASFVITNSFHATAFSLMFERQFIEVFPKRFSTRIMSILKLVGLEDTVIVKDRNDYSYGTDKYDYARINEILEHKREESIDFLRNALNN